MLLTSIGNKKSQETTSSVNDGLVGSSTSTRNVGQKSLGQDDFLRLIGVQLTNQDPSKPMDDTSFIAQMAQFTSLDQTKQLVTQFGQMRSTNSLSVARSLIGQQVTLTDPKTGELKQGVVTAVDNTSDSEASIVMNGTSYSLSTILRVEAAPTTTTTSTTTTSSN